MSDWISKELKWWQRGVVYQIYPCSFFDTNGDGIGDLQGVIEKLDYLNGSNGSLGIDAIWLSPFYPSPMADFGYDVSDYCSVHPLFGDLAVFDQLVDEAHRREIKVIIDYVPNHTSDQHPWFLASRSSRNNPHRDWYIWRDPQPGGGPPNNWGSMFGGPAWEWDGATGQYYFHHFLKEQPDLNWRNPEVRQSMLDVLRFWLDRGVDGFRMDVVGMILKDPEFRDNPLVLNPQPGLPEEDLWSRQHNLYNQDQDEVHEITSEIRRVLDSYGERCAIGEVWYDLPRWVKYYGEQGLGLQLPFNFRLIHLPWQAGLVRRSIDELEASLPSFAWPNYVLGNHDVTRLATRVGQDQARVAAMLLLTLRGTPTLYYGDEIGLENGEIAPEKIQDPQGVRLGAGRSRDGARTPMQWDPSPQSGFSEVEPWLPVSKDYFVRNAAVQAQEPRSLLHLYRRLLRYRRSTPALLSGSYRSLETGCEGCFAFLREHPQGSRLVALNFTRSPQSLALPLSGKGQLAISTKSYGEDAGKTVVLDALSLKPDEGVVIELH